MTWVVTVHYTAGSAGEALDVQFAMSVPSEEAAESITDNLNAIWAQRGDEEYAQYFKVDEAARLKLPLASPALMAQEGLDPATLDAGQIALDTGELARMISEGVDIEVLPAPVKPPTPEEEQAAIDSIMRTTRDA